MLFCDGYETSLIIFADVLKIGVSHDLALYNNGFGIKGGIQDYLFRRSYGIFRQFRIKGACYFITQCGGILFFGIKSQGFIVLANAIIVGKRRQDERYTVYFLTILFAIISQLHSRPKRFFGMVKIMTLKVSAVLFGELPYFVKTLARE